MFNFGMISTINKATHDTIKAATAIDHIFTNAVGTLNLRQGLSTPTSSTIFQSSLQVTFRWKSIPKKNCNIFLNSLMRKIP